MKLTRATRRLSGIDLRPRLAKLDIRNCGLRNCNLQGNKATKLSVIDPKRTLVVARYDRLQRGQTIGQCGRTRLQD
jgi:hypothetical protein